MYGTFTDCFGTARKQFFFLFLLYGKGRGRY